MNRFNLKRQTKKQLKIILLILFIVFCLSAFDLFDSDNKNYPKDDLNDESGSKNEQKSPIIKFYDDSNVDTSNYAQEYRLRSEKFKNLIEKRNLENSHFKNIIKYEREPKHIDLDYIVLVYTTAMNQKKFCEHFENGKNDVDNVILSQCPYKNCKFSCDQSVAHKSDAILFHERDLAKLDSESTYDIKLFERKFRRNDQIAILWNDEPTISPKMNKFHFNWTMSYRMDAEISDCSYGCSYANINKELSLYESFVTEYKLAFKNKQKKALWAVSNCGASERMKFGIELKNHFPVKVIGGCANYFAHPNSYMPLFIRDFFFNEAENCPRQSKCENNLFTNSKFYLSFESYNCTDYLTEKIWRILRTDMIPVVYQPSKEDYERVLPPDSFIHAQDFDLNPRKLADYLEYVSTNFTAYYKHHSWKFNANVVFSGQQAEKRRMCEMCTKLNTETSVIYYENISKWFNSGCKK